MPKPVYRGFLASSVDPTQLSLTVEAISKVVIGILVWWGVSKGMNPATAQTQLQGITDLVAQAIPMGFTFWSTCLAIWGLVRKVYTNFTA